jgi:hypothetical protein
VLDAPRIRLALARGDVEIVGALVRQHPRSTMQTWFGLAGDSTLLDALAALRDRRAVEERTAPLLSPRTYLEPFALRALGIVREDEELIRRAVERFERMQLGWHADQTTALLELEAKT